MKTEQELKAIAFDEFMESAQSKEANKELMSAHATLSIILTELKVKEYDSFNHVDLRCKDGFAEGQKKFSYPLPGLSGRQAGDVDKNGVAGSPKG